MTAPETIDAAPQPVARTVVLLCAVALLWLVTRPYFGVVQDARFYMLEALHGIDAGHYAGDMYFQFGSQGSFSIFARLYPPLLAAFGVGATGIILTVIGQFLWLRGLFCLARTLAGPRLMWLSIVLVIGVLNIYAPYFGYGEAFVTPRLYAEALTMLALSLLPSHTRWAFVVLALAALLHPLMALPGLAVAFVYLALGQPLWWGAAAAGIGLAAALGLAGIQPFADLFRTIDPAWFAVIKVREIQCLLTTWPAGSFVQVFQVLAWAVFALVTVGERHRRFLGATLAVGIGGLACTLLGADFAHNAFVVEIQPWRALWLLQLVTRIYIPVIFATLVAKSSFRDGVLGGLRLPTLLTMALILVSSITRLARYPYSAEFTGISLMLEIVALAVLSAQLLLEDPKQRRLAQFSAIVAFALIPVALWRWDGRAPWTRFVESPAPAPEDLAVLLPPNASVYWEASVETLWFRLRRASYFSCDQGTGAVFHRDTALTYRHRSDSFWPLRVSDFHQSDACAGFDTAPKPDRTQAGLRNLCIREPGLDYMVLSAPLDGVKAQIWKAPVRFQDIHMSDGQYFERVTDRFYIYSCAQLR